MTKGRIIRGQSAVPHCAFTFDDGPMRVSIDPWLDALEQGGARGTFFLTGEWFDQFPAKAREMLARGHELAMHTYHHRRMADVSREVFFEEMKLAELAYQEATGRPAPGLIRFPYASYRQESLDWLQEWNYLLIEGEDTIDWAGPPSAELVERVAPMADNGAIFMFHANEIAKETPKAVEVLLHHTAAKGLAAVTVSQLLEADGISTGERSWQVRIRPALQDYPNREQWRSIGGDDDLKKLAADSLQWGNPHAPTGWDANRKWLQALSAESQTNGEKRFAVRSFADQHWAFVRASVRGRELVLEDYGTKEAHADALANILEWAAQEAHGLGCEWITCTRDMRLIHKLCGQLGFESELVLV